MKAVYRSRLKPIFRDQLQRVQPAFEPLAIRVPAAEKQASTAKMGEFAFAWRRRPDLWLILSVVPHSRQERFSIDAGWSRRGRFPFDIRRPTPSPRAGPVIDTKNDEALYGYVDFLLAATGTGVFFGWEVWKCSVPPEHPEFRSRFIAEDLQPVTDELAESRVQAAVTSALADILKVVIPVLERVE